MAGSLFHRLQGERNQQSSPPNRSEYLQVRCQSPSLWMQHKVYEQQATGLSIARITLLICDFPISTLLPQANVKTSKSIRTHYIYDLS